jgi:hypothetical protein
MASAAGAGGGESFGERGGVTLEIGIDLEEWEIPRRLCSIINCDERSALGYVRLRSDGERRSWAATDSVCAAICVGSPDDDVYEVLVSPAVIRFAAVAGDSDGLTSLILEGDIGHRRITVTGVGGALTVDEALVTFPDVDGVVSVPVDTVATARFRAGVLQDCTAAHWLRESGEDVSSGPPVSIGFADGVCTITSQWREVGDSNYQVPSFDHEGEGSRAVNPIKLAALLALVPPESEISLSSHVQNGLRFESSVTDSAARSCRSPASISRSANMSKR